MSCMVLLLRSPSILGSPAQQVLTSPRKLMCRPRQGAAQYLSSMELFNGLFAGEIGKAEPELEPLWCAGLDIVFLL